MASAVRLACTSIVGGVRSATVIDRFAEPALPAASVAEQVTVDAAIGNVAPDACVHVTGPAMPLRLSAAVAGLNVTAAPAALVASARIDGSVNVSTGAVASRLTVTLNGELATLSPFVAVQVNATPAVSAFTSWLSHPLLDKMPDSGSTVVQETVTSLVYQPLLPSVPVTCGVTTGGVGSVT